MLAATPFECAEFQIVFWETGLTAYQAAGGSEPTDEDRRHALPKILPPSFCLEMKTKANAEGSADGLKEWIRAQAELIRARSGKGTYIMEHP